MASVTTSFLLSNIHCPSCVSHIEDALYALSPRPQSVSPSIVSSWVTVRHMPELSVSALRKALEAAGFDISDVASDVTLYDNEDATPTPRRADDSDGLLDQIVASWKSRSSAGLSREFEEKKRRRHVKNCDMCRVEEERSHDGPHLVDGSEGNGHVPNGKAKGISPEVTRVPSSSERTVVVIDSPDSAENDSWTASLAIGGMTCASCANNITKELEKQDWVQKVVVNLIANSAMVEFTDRKHLVEIAELIEDIGYEATLDSVVEKKPVQSTTVSEDLWKASVAIGGMTCASCAGNITRELEKKDWVQKVVVNLIQNSATIEFKGKEHESEICEAIEDIGYDVTMDSVVEKRQTRDTTQRRTVEILVQGMYCGHCPSRVSKALQSFGAQVDVERAATRENPILKISYIPDAPTFTVRHILAAISAAEEAFEPSIYHPPTLEERSRKIHAKEQQRILLRVTLTLIIAIPTFVIGIVFMSLVPDTNPHSIFLMNPWAAGVSRAQWALFIMATPVYFLAADVFHRRAIKEIRSMWRPGSRTPFLQRFYRFGSMNMLMSLGTSIAYFSSIAQIIVVAVHPRAKLNNDAFYFDSVVFLTMFLLIGRLIESYSKSKTGDAVTMLGKLRPTEALLITDNDGEKHTESVNVDLLEFGDTVRVNHGGSPPCDGVILEGQSSFDESSLTGESRLVKKNLGDEVFSGTVNKDAPVTIRITGVAGESMLDQIVKAVREGQTRRAPIERIADSLTSYFVPFVTLIAVLTWVIWMSLGLSGSLPKDYLDVESGGWTAWALEFAIAVFVVACPCGLALAAPTALFVGGGLAAQHGILVKGGGEAFEKASRLDCIVFDKTGTLTMGGEPSITDSEILSAEDESVVISMVKAIEESSSHPIAKAIVNFCKSKQAAYIQTLRVEEVAGKGMFGSFVKGSPKKSSESKGADFDMVIGNEALMTDYGVEILTETVSTLDTWKKQGKSIALAAMRSHNGGSGSMSSSQATISNPWTLAAAFAISDPIRPEAPYIISALRAQGTTVYMLSGDNAHTATAIGAMVGIPSTNIIAGVLPSQKAEKIQELQRSLKKREGQRDESSTERAMVAMLGDGINDSPALTTADVGIAIGSGSDIAISSAEFVLVNSNLHTLLTLLDLSKVVFRRIKFNFAWALVYNLVALPVAAGVLYPVVSHHRHIRLDPVWASLAMAASSVSVVLSSLALRSGVPFLGFKARRRE
jgi:Cu+-exporting ATPase